MLTVGGEDTTKLLNLFICLVTFHVFAGVVFIDKYLFHFAHNTQYRSVNRIEPIVSV